MSDPADPHETMVHCPHCGAVISLSKAVCDSCGKTLRLITRHTTSPLNRTPSALAHRAHVAVPLTDDQMVLLQVLPSGACVALPELRRIILGRPAIENPEYLDLSPYNAARQGVSRRHCRLERRDYRLYITDLHSTNGTYVNGEYLTPDVPHVLTDGDQVILGLLYVNVFFGKRLSDT